MSDRGIHISNDAIGAKPDALLAVRRHGRTCITIRTAKEGETHFVGKPPKDNETMRDKTLWEVWLFDFMAMQLFGQADIVMNAKQRRLWIECWYQRIPEET